MSKIEDNNEKLKGKYFFFLINRVYIYFNKEGELLE